MNGSKTLVIDNYDSFVYNLIQYIGKAQGNPIVYRNDKLTLDEAKKLNPTHIVLSPGPGNPTDQAYFGICSKIITEMGDSTPLLGVCLGHQGIGAKFGGNIIQSPKIMHGKTSNISICNESKLFKGINKTFEVMRYHSLAVDPSSLDKNMIITSKTDDGTIMSFEHKSKPIYGVQFHPESIGTPDGMQIIKNFLSL